MKKFILFVSLFLFLFFYAAVQGHAQELQPQVPQNCAISDRLCILMHMEKQADTIENQSWRDQTYREIAKTYAFEDKIDEAIRIAGKIYTPDTKAMAIRGIGMAAADSLHSKGELDVIFGKLHAEAAKIAHPPSHAIALTYIAMAQAFAGDDEGSWKTAESMQNEALRHKAYGETAEIQAEKGHFNAAMTSISKISAGSFRDKAYETVSRILSDKGLYNEAYNAGILVANPYKKVQALQYLLDKQRPRDVPHQQDP